MQCVSNFSLLLQGQFGEEVGDARRETWRTQGTNKAVESFLKTKETHFKPATAKKKTGAPPKKKCRDHKFHDSPGVRRRDILDSQASLFSWFAGIAGVSPHVAVASVTYAIAGVVADVTVGDHVKSTLSSFPDVFLRNVTADTNVPATFES